MNRFERLLEVVLAEMPLRHVYTDPKLRPHKKKRDRDPQNYTDGDGLGHETLKAYTSVKFQRVLSAKLTRMTHLPLNLFVFGRWPFARVGWDGKNNRPVNNTKLLAKLVKMDISQLDDAINLVITGDNAQLAMSPWLLLHQFAEGVTNQFGNIEDHKESRDVVDAYREEFKVGGPGVLNRIFAMKSARDGTMNDFLQELITEYLWHGGRIRRRYPDGLDKSRVDQFVTDFEVVIKNLLQQCVGTVIFNSV